MSDESMHNEIRRISQLVQLQVQKHNAEFGTALMDAWFDIIPSPCIEDNAIIVSQKVYDAVRAALEGKL